jgi:hypothetical protein
MCNGLELINVAPCIVQEGRRAVDSYRKYHEIMRDLLRGIRNTFLTLTLGKRSLVCSGLPLVDLPALAVALVSPMSWWSCRCLRDAAANGRQSSNVGPEPWCLHDAAAGP